MPFAIYTPRINNNDDFVRVTHLYPAAGSHLRPGDLLADLETDKATFTVEAEREGYLLRFQAELGQSIAVGSILAWMGETAREALPAESAGEGATSGAGGAGRPTLKAALLLATYRLSAAEVPAAGERLTGEDIERYVARRPVRAQHTQDTMPCEPGRKMDLRGSELGMRNTVLWQKEAVPAYLEIAYDPQPWNSYAADFQRRNRLLMNPLLALFVSRLARIAAAQPGVNATVNGAEKYVYEHVNVGFTIQSRSSLYVVVVREAETLDELEAVRKLGELERAAMRGTLDPADISGATIGLSSMARWAVTRHVPVLLPQTGLMIAHSAAANGLATLGATYDHRLLDGADVFQILEMLSQPPRQE